MIVNDVNQTLLILFKGDIIRSLFVRGILVWQRVNLLAIKMDRHPSLRLLTGQNLLVGRFDELNQLGLNL